MELLAVLWSLPCGAALAVCLIVAALRDSGQMHLLLPKTEQRLQFGGHEIDFRDDGPSEVVRVDGEVVQFRRHVSGLPPGEVLRLEFKVGGQDVALRGFRQGLSTLDIRLEPADHNA